MSIFSDQFDTYGPGQKAPISGLKVTALKDAFRTYKRAVAKRYEIVKPTRIGRDLAGESLHISTKIDGELWFLVKHQGEVALCAPNGRVLQGIPAVAEAEKHLAQVDGDILIPGELFAIGGEGRPRVHHVAKTLGDGERAKFLGFKAFDLVYEGEKVWRLEPYKDRFERLEEIFKGGKRVGPVQTVIGDNQAAVGCYQEWVASKRAEGLVVRNELGKTYKVKPIVTVDAVVVAFGERKGPELSQVRELTVALMRDDGSFQILGTVSNGLSDQDRLEWFDRLSAMEVPSSFRMANREGTLCRFVRPEIILEIQCSDLLAAESDDSPVRKMVVNYSKEEGYEAVGGSDIVSLVHPRIARERSDKTLDSDNVGLSQVYNVVPFENRHGSVEKVELPTAKVLDRKVFVKVTKGRKMVRKYVAIETNKSDMDKRHPPYVVYFTDYSPNRAEPLKTSLKVTGALEGVDTIVEEWMTKNIKRGWNPAEA